MKCPKCESTKNKITDTENREDYRWRRRECCSCGTRWTTYELRTDLKTGVKIPKDLEKTLMPLFLKLCEDAVMKNVGAKLAKLLGEIALAETSTP